MPCKGYFYESSVLLFLVACGSFACALCSRKIAYIKYICTPTPMWHLSAGIFSTHEKNFDRLYKYPSKTTVESGGTTISQPKGRLFAAFALSDSSPRLGRRTLQSRPSAPDRITMPARGFHFCRNESPLSGFRSSAVAGRCFAKISTERFDGTGSERTKLIPNDPHSGGILTNGLPKHGFP